MVGWRMVDELEEEKNVDWVADGRLRKETKHTN